MENRAKFGRGLNETTNRMGRPRRKNQGACGGTPRRDGSGGGIGNRGTSRQPKY